MSKGAYSDVPLDDMKVVFGDINSRLLHSACICCHCGLVTKMPELCGCTQKQDCLICHAAKKFQCLDMHKACMKSQGRSYCLDLEMEMKGEGGICGGQSNNKQCFMCTQQADNNCGIIPLNCKVANHCLCCDYRCACPPDDEVPCQITMCGKILWEKK